MWLNKGFYEALPFLYIGVGAALLIASLYVEHGGWALCAALLGLLWITGGLVVWLRRRDYRSSRSRTAFDETR